MNICCWTVVLRESFLGIFSGTNPHVQSCPPIAGKLHLCPPPVKC